MSIRPFVRRNVLPAAVFVAVMAAHFLWLGLFPERDPVQARWVTVAKPDRLPWISSYVETKSYWLSYTYALSLTFAAAALRRYWEQRVRAARNLAIGGVTLSGFLAVAGCFLLGCCGSPMLGVYLSWFGASFLPLAKPLMAGIATLMIGASWWWMWHRGGHLPSGAETNRACPSGTCGCPPAARDEDKAHHENGCS